MTIVPVRLQRLDRLKSAPRFGLFMLALGAAIASAAGPPPSQAPDLQHELQAAAAADKAGDWDWAEAPLRKALELAPSLLAASYELGDVYVQKRQWEAAVRKLRPALEDPTLNYQVCLDLAKAEAAQNLIPPSLADQADARVSKLQSVAVTRTLAPNAFRIGGVG